MDATAPQQTDPLSEMCLRINSALGTSTKTLFQLYALLPPASLRARNIDANNAAEVLAQSVRDLDGSLYKKCHNAEISREMRRLCAYIQTQRFTLLHPYMKGYPKLLQEIPDRPLVLYARGNVGCLQDIQIAIVGSRRATPPALQMARQLARQLCDAGIVVTSGLARGCDIAAHQGAIETSDNGKIIAAGLARTVAVLGHGVDVIYPAQHRRIADTIVQNGGCLVSEFNPGVPPLPHHFPKRNRIIAGLAVATIVVEAGLKSGSLISARLANEYGRDVFAVPGSPSNAMARGCHKLLKSGAHLLEDTNDLADVLEQRWPVFRQVRGLTTDEQNITTKTETSSTLAPRFRHYLNQIGANGIEVGEFAQTCNLNIIQAHTVLMDFEIQGMVRQTMTGKFFKLV